jgi:WD40 repeat protein
MRRFSRPQAWWGTAAVLAVSTALTTVTALLAQPPTKGTVVGKLQGHDNPVYAVAWSSDGKWIVTAGFDGTVRVWDAVKQAEVKSFPAHRDLVLCLALDKQGRRIVSGGLDKAAKVWLMPDAAPERTITGNPEGVAAFATDLAGKLAAVGAGRAVRIWDLTSGTSAPEIKGHAKDIVALAWDDSGAKLASGDQAGVLSVWDASSRDPKGSIETTAKQVLSLALSSGSAPRVLSGGPDGHLRIWTLPSVPPPSLHVTAPLLSPSPDASKLAAAESKDLVIWDTATGKKSTLRTFDKAIGALDWQSDGMQIAVGFNGHTAQIVSSADGQTLFSELKSIPSEITALAFRNGHGQLSVGCAVDNHVLVYDLA